VSRIIFATSNKGKADWLQRIINVAGLDWKVDAQKMDLTEIQSEDIATISLFKARQAYESVKKPVLVMDGGLFINGLNGFPGPYIRFMIDIVGVHGIAKIVSTLDDKRCQWRNVATYIEGPDQYHQFLDDTGEIYSLTDQVWPHDNPAQWAPIWRILVPSGLGYTKPLSGFTDAELDAYALERSKRVDDNSCLNKAVEFLKTREQNEQAQRTVAASA
jgi:non-canonical purine NTP pyrophosphatase (RdgB/HAM1 family)